MDLEKAVANLTQRVTGQFYGKYRAVVSNNNDPKHLGRLKLKVPSLLGPEIETGWAMPCVPYGGYKNQGFLTVPDLDAGIWVEFEGGDLDFPIWVGTYWGAPGGESEVPTLNDAEGKEHPNEQEPPTRRILKTNKGHTIQFEDADGEEMVIIIQRIDKNTCNIITMNKEGIKIADGANDHKLVLDSNGMSIESAADVTITGKNISIEATGKLTAKGNPIHLNP